MREKKIYKLYLKEEKEIRKWMVEIGGVSFTAEIVECYRLRTV